MPNMPTPADVSRRIHESLRAAPHHHTGMIRCPGYEHLRFSTYPTGDVFLMVYNTGHGAKRHLDLPIAMWPTIDSDGTLHCEKAPPSVLLFLSTDRGRDPLCQDCPLQLTCLGELVD